MRKNQNSKKKAPDEPLDIWMLIEQYHDSVYRYSYRLIGRKSDAEDVTQQTFLIATQKLSQLKNPKSARSWLLTIARNCFLKRLRRKQAVNASEIELDVNQIVESAPSKNKYEETDVGLSALKKAVEDLDDNQRLVITMFYFEKLSYREIATQLELPLGTVMSRLSRAKTKLRNVLEKISADTGRYSQ